MPARPADPGPVRIRPRRIRVVAWVAAAAVVVAAVALGAALRGPVAGGESEFGPADRLALVGLGAIGAAVLLSLTRPLVEADADGIWVRNIVGGSRLRWSEVQGVRFDRGSSWATLELTDGEVVAVLAVQAVDREHALAAVRALRALHAGHQRQASS